MTEHKFPDPQRIYWNTLEVGDVVWTYGVVHAISTDDQCVFLNREPKSSGSIPVLDVYGKNSGNSHGHVIKAPRPIAVGDKVGVGV